MHLMEIFKLNEPKLCRDCQSAGHHTGVPPVHVILGAHPLTHSSHFALKVSIRPEEQVTRVL